MPRYDYWCEGCEKSFTLSHSWKEKILNCPECKDTKFSKILTAPRFVKKVIVKEPTGTVVKQSIKNAKKEIKLEKNRLRKRKK